jgi:hypothetical protein
VQESLVASAEAAPIVLNRVTWNRRIAEARVSLNVWRSSFIHIAPRRCKTIVKTLSSNFRKIGGRRRLIVNRMRMRTPGNRERQRQNCQGKPFLHIMSSSL